MLNQPAELQKKSCRFSGKRNRKWYIFVISPTRDLVFIKMYYPWPSEKVITKTEVNSFLHTDLLEYLRNKKVTRLVIIGMQTHMCLEAAVRAAYDFGFDCVVISDACATKDLTFEGKTVPAEEVQTVVFATITKGGYSKVIDFKSFKKNSDTYIFKK